MLVAGLEGHRAIMNLSLYVERVHYFFISRKPRMKSETLTTKKQRKKKLIYMPRVRKNHIKTCQVKYAFLIFLLQLFMELD